MLETMAARSCVVASMSVEDFLMLVLVMLLKIAGGGIIKGLKLRYVFAS